MYRGLSVIPKIWVSGATFVFESMIFPDLITEVALDAVGERSHLQ
jgi:hypothetical protein